MTPAEIAAARLEALLDRRGQLARELAEVEDALWRSAADQTAEGGGGGSAARAPACHGAPTKLKNPAKKGPPISALAIRWEETVITQTADEFLAKAGQQVGKRVTIIKQRRDLLKHGPRRADEMMDALLDAGHSKNTIGRPRARYSGLYKPGAAFGPI